MHQRLLVRAALAGLVGAFTVTCSAPEASESSSHRQAVLGGEPTGDARAGVLYVTSEIRNVGGQQITKIGSGALVAPNLLATALHVVSQNPSNVPFTCDASGDVVSGSSGASLGAAVAPEKITVYAGPHPAGEPVAHGVSVVSSGSTTICQNDLAFVVLSEPLALPTYRIRRSTRVAIGDAMTVVGYGSGRDSGLGSAVRSERDVTATAIGQWIRTFTVTLGPCAGDSGGPALTLDGELVGVFSSVAVDCTGPSAAPKYTDLSYFEPLIELAFAEAGAGSPWKTSEAGGEGGGAATGEAGMPAAGGEPPGAAATDNVDGGCGIVKAGNGGVFPLGVLLAGAVLWRKVSRRGRTARAIAQTRASIARSTRQGVYR
jgi:S1-C subfamily serine protease